MRAAAFVLLLTLAAAAEEPTKIAWEKDLTTARNEAARDGRPLLLYFTFDT